MEWNELYCHLVTSTSEINLSIQTYIQYDKGVGRTGRQGIEGKIQHDMRRGEEKKATPRLCSCKECRVGTGKKNTSATLAQSVHFTT